MIVIASSGPDWCWHCGGKLARAPAHGPYALHAELVKDPLGNEHRCHKVCSRSAARKALTVNDVVVRSSHFEE